MWQIDAFLLDRVFQPIANLIHQWFGITPTAIGEFFAAGNVAAMMADYLFKHPDFPYKLYYWDLLFTIGAAAAMAAIIIFPRVPERHGVNYKRYRLFSLRVMELFFSVGDCFTAIILFHHQSFWLHATTAASTVFIWLGLNFVSLSMPPPRQVRQWKWKWAPA